MRTFVAIDLEPEIKDSIAAFIDQHKRFQADIKWASRQGLHLTLKFLGEINQETASKVETNLDFISNDFSAFRLSFEGTGWFPAAKRTPRVFWIGVKEHENIIPLQKSVETNLNKIGFPLEKRKFHPHLTLGRVRSTRNLDAVRKELTEHCDKNFGSMTIKHLIFFQSILKPTGAEYSIISKHGLKL